MPRTVKDVSYSQQHVIERALEIYNLVLTETDYMSLNSRVLDNESERMGEEAGDIFWGISWEGHTLICVWNKALGRITTLLPPETVIRRKRGRQ